MESREKKGAARAILLVGSGQRPREIGAVLAALAALRAEAGEGAEPVRPHGLGDLEELLSRGPGYGTLILEYGRVPAEDIGFVRRFLERHPSWRLLVVGDDPQAPSARGLLGLPRSQWVPWPPDLEQLRALLTAPPPPGTPPPGSTPPAPSPPAPSPSAPPSKRKSARPRRAGPSPSIAPVDPIDVGMLLEELLASSALAGEGAPRYLFRCDQPVSLLWERSSLSELLSSFLSLARRCAGEDGVVSAQVDPIESPASPPEAPGADAESRGEGVRLRIDFPIGPLTDGDLPGLIEGPFEGAEELAEEASLSLDASERLRRRGGRADLVPHKHGRLRLELFLPRIPRPDADDRRGGSPSSPSSEQGSPEDPFA
jgi:hypothetical protein